jgi:hypothetical protein
VPYAKLLAHCPQSIINTVNYAGQPDFIAVSACLKLAEEDGLIIVERWKGRRNTYRLPPPQMGKAQRQTATGNSLTLISNG